MSMNLWLGLGRMVKDPETRYTPQGLAVCNFAIACNNKYKNKSGEECEEVYFQNCVAFGNSAGFIAQYVTKGDLVFVEGRLKTEEWEDKQNGQKRTAVKCMCQQVQLCGKPKGTGEPREEKPAKNKLSVPDNASQPDADEDGPPF